LLNGGADRPFGPGETQSRGQCTAKLPRRASAHVLPLRQHVLQRSDLSPQLGPSSSPATDTLCSSSSHPVFRHCSGRLKCVTASEPGCLLLPVLGHRRQATTCPSWSYPMAPGVRPNRRLIDTQIYIFTLTSGRTSQATSNSNTNSA
jgi:hypothetical protein